MTDTLWNDISEFNPIVNNSYPYRWISFRSNDGTYTDAHFYHNLSWMKSAFSNGRLDGAIIYAVYRPDGGQWATQLMKNIGTPGSRVAVMVDVESWNGEISGNRSADINANIARLAKWLGSRDRVLGYGNVSDLNTLWPNKPAGQKLVVAAYGDNPSYPGKIAHQYTSQASTPPFGHPVDLNSADGYTSPALSAALGLPSNQPVPVPPTPKPPAPSPVAPRPAPHYPLPAGYYFGPEGGPVQSVSGYHGHRADLMEWQAQMRARGWGIQVDGLYGPVGAVTPTGNTASVTEAFQKEKGLTVDGLIGPITWGAAWTDPIT